MLKKLISKIHDSERKVMYGKVNLSGKVLLLDDNVSERKANIKGA